MMEAGAVQLFLQELQRGSLEAHELRDQSKDFNGKGVNKAVDNINTLIADTLIGSDAGDQSKSRSSST